MAIATENEAYPSPDIATENPLSNCRKTALQSNKAPSDKNSIKHIIPKISTGPFGKLSLKSSDFPSKLCGNNFEYCV